MRSFDGFKYICLDNFPAKSPPDYLKANDDDDDGGTKSSENESDDSEIKCLIYSFGLGKDWTFEREMIKLGNKKTQKP